MKDTVSIERLGFIAVALSLSCGCVKVIQMPVMPNFVTYFPPHRVRCLDCEGQPHTSFYTGELP